MNCVVADAGPLIALAKLELLDLPGRIFGQVLVPQTVLDECREQVYSRAAAKLGAAVVGVCGLPLFAKREGWIAEVLPLLDFLRISGYYISPALRERVLLQSGEAWRWLECSRH